ncbi:MAG: hypothetical protein VX000_07530, partial [Myxococcota bacterium]|nr:hypothetical protein [Myxococcota bacterium]
ATLNMDAEGTVVGGTVRGRLKLAGFFDGTEVSMGILPGGQVAPGIRDVPVKVGPATGTMDLMLDEGGLSGSGEIQAHSLGLPAWMGIEGGAMKVAIKDSSVSGTGLLQGRPTPQGVATAQVKLTETTMTTKVTFVVTPGLEPVPRVRIDKATLTGTVTQDLGDTNLADTPSPWGGTTEGSEAPATESAPSASHAPSEHRVYGEGLGATDDIFDVATGGQTPPTSRIQGGTTPSGGTGGGSTSGASTGSGGATPGASLEPPGPRDPDAFLLRGKGKVTIANWVTGDMDLAYDPRAGTFDASGRVSAETERSYGDLLSYKAEIAVDIDQNVPTDAEAAIYFTSEEYKLRGKITGDFDIQSEEIDGDVNARTTHHIPFEGSHGRVRILRHSKVVGKYRDNELRDLTGRLKMDADLLVGSDTPLQLKGEVEGAFDHRTGTVVGSTKAWTKADFVLPGAAGG